MVTVFMAGDGVHLLAADAIASLDGQPAEFGTPSKLVALGTGADTVFCC